MSICMNFPFFMLMIRPSQTGKTTWMLDFIKHFSYINPGHTLTNVLYLHMSDFDMPYCYDDNMLKFIKFYLIKSNMADDGSHVDNKIISEIESFKKKVRKKR